MKVIGRQKEEGKKYLYKKRERDFRREEGGTRGGKRKALKGRLQ